MRISKAITNKEYVTLVTRAINTLDQILVSEKFKQLICPVRLSTSNLHIDYLDIDKNGLHKLKHDALAGDYRSLIQWPPNAEDRKKLVTQADVDPDELDNIAKRLMES